MHALRLAAHQQRWHVMSYYYMDTQQIERYVDATSYMFIITAYLKLHS